MPLISIITVTYNAERFIEECISSVLNQTFTDFEYIVIDGNSTDSTVGIIKKYSNNIHKIVVEADSGIYDAMNKGINLASGEYLYFLGADDTLYSNLTLDKVASSISSNDFPAIVYGNVVYDNGKSFKSVFGFKTLLNNTIHHQSAFYNKKLFTTFRYDLNYRLISDYELNLLIFINNGQKDSLLIPEIISRCTDGGQSRSQLKLAMSETNMIRHKILGWRAIPLKWIYSLKFYITEYVI